MNIINVSKVTKEFNGETLFQNVSFEINANEKMAIIGKNGTGKSTLIKMILGEIEYDQGDIFKNPKAKIGYLSQTVISNKDLSLEEEIHEVFRDLLVLEDKIKDLTKEIETDPKNQELIDRYATLENAYLTQGGYEYHYKIDMILSKFGFTKDMYDRQISTFSGGEKTRVAFAKLLLENPDLLILDEPTNHLDISIIEWLEEYLNKYDGAVLIITHDKYFISKVCRKMLELDQQTAHMYYGTFEQYEDQKVARYEQLLKQYNRQQKEIAHLQSFVDRFRYNSKRASIVKDREKKIARIEKIDKPTISKRNVKMSFSKKRTTRDIIIQAKDLAFGYETILQKDISFTMRGFDKLAIIGPNGTGKTTLLKIIEQKMKPMKGKLELLRQFKIGYFDQNQDRLHLNKTIFEEIHDIYPMFTNKDIRSIAARFLFYNEDLDKPISILSGGEKVRLVLLLLLLEDPDLLILDEPTNHLDIETKNVIEDVFDEFTGPILFVSHDRYFINKIGTKILYLSDQTPIEFNGSYDAFKDARNQESTKQKQPKKKKEIVVNITKKLKQLESEIHKLEQNIQEKEAKTFLEEYYLDKRKITKLHEEIEEDKRKLELLFTEYYEFAEE